MTRPKALLFDIGNVVIRVDMQRSFDHWGVSSGVHPSNFAARHQRDAVHQQYERGEIETAVYMTHLRQLLGLEIGLEQMVEGWNALLLEEVDGIAEVLQRLAGAVPLYAFSNTNRAHVEHLTARFGSLLDLFDEVFVSSSIGHRKPEPQSFRHVADAIGVTPAEILFFDDLMENIDGARAVGLQAVHVRAHADVLDALDRHGF